MTSASRPRRATARRALFLAAASFTTLLLLHAPRVDASAGTWSTLRQAPQPRAKHAAVYDSHRQRMILFGGRCIDACCSDGVVPNDLWMLPLDADRPQWVEVHPGGTAPPAGLGPAAIYDPVRDRMLVPGTTGQVWQLALANAPVWSEIVPAGAPPPNVVTAVHDPVRDRMLVLSSTGRVWSLAFAADTQWVELLPTGKLPARIVAALYDPVRDRMVVLADSMRALALGGPPAWSVLGASRPLFLTSYSAVYDPLRDRAVIHGGCRAGGCGTTETWGFDLAGSAAWTQLSASGPLLSSHSAIYDPVRDRMVAFGGYAKQFYTDWSIGEVWTMACGAGAEWRDVTAAGPPAACGAAAVLDPLRQRMVVVADSVRVMALAGLPRWSTLDPAGTPPVLPRTDYAAIYDPLRDRIVLYGGNAEGAALNDLWSLSLDPPQWTPFAAAGSPPAEAGPAVYDAAHDRMVIVTNGHAWALSLAGSPAWTDLAPAGTAPDAVIGTAAVADAPRDRLLIFGGATATGYSSAVWQLSLGVSPAWSMLAPAGTPPVPRRNAIAVFDPARDRLVVAAGDTGTTATLTDTWSLSLAGGGAWSLLAAGTPHGRTAVLDAARDRIVALSACDEASNPECAAPLPACWVLPFSNGSLAVPSDVVRPRLALAQSRPNPVRGTCAIPFTLGRAGHVTLRVYDLAGRLSTTLIDGPLAAGDHLARWDAAHTDAGRIPAGVYFYELRASGERQQRRMILLR